MIGLETYVRVSVCVCVNDLFMSAQVMWNYSV